MTDTAPAAVLVRLSDQERAVIGEHADALTVPVSTVLKRMALAGVRATRAAGVTAQQLVNGAAAALGRDFPTWGEGSRRRTAESVMRWLLARCAVVPLPAPLTAKGVWAVQLADGQVMEVRAGEDHGHGTVTVHFADGYLTFQAGEFRALAAAGLAAAGLAEQQPEGGRS
ncbi:hypothetical protein [Actinophytocola sp.]|uniref:hypothetical protein n=1 Tax=Actinophytocola sp. TaxID=1872138 RepID=UPI002D36C60E|nr:hypothetical protein [Actinophytocola sp.]HYQ69092.1 hypothetical protein [Actinophytocola sp.]